MLKIAIIQEDSNVFNLVKNLLTVNNTDLAKFCRINGLDYFKTYRFIQHNFVNIEELQELLYKIDPTFKLEL